MLCPLNLIYIDKLELHMHCCFDLHLPLSDPSIFGRQLDYVDFTYSSGLLLLAKDHKAF
jgi:hypothetical protein